MQLDFAIPEEFVTKTEIYDYKTEVPKLIGRISKLGTIIVTKDGAYHGIIEDMMLTQANIAKLPKATVGKFAIKMPALSSEVTIEKALRYFYESNARALPFIKGHKIIGVVRREKLLETLLSLHLLSKVKAGDIMTSPIIGIDANANAAEALATMRKNNTNRLLIISKNKPSGIITNGDIAFMLAKPQERLPEMKKEAHALEGIKVFSIGQPYLYTIDFEKSVDDAIRSMVEKGVAAIAVTRNGKIVGLITARDIFKYAITNMGREVPVYLSGLEAYAKTYEEDVKQAFEKLSEKVSRFTKVNPEALFVNVKSKKSVYEISAHIRFAKNKEIRASASDESLDETVKEVIDRLYERVKKEKEKGIMEREKRGSVYAE